MGFQKLSPAILLLAFIFLQASAASAAKKSYIVYMGVHSHGSNPTELDSQRATDSHHQFLASFLGSHEKAKDAILYSYNKYINGFSAMLDEEVAAEIGKHSKVVSVFMDKPKKLHTTHSWDFMRQSKNNAPLAHSLLTKARFGEDAIIANLDTGVWPESASFDDTGYGPIPKRFIGACDDGGTNFKCNRKLIGARFYSTGYLGNGGKINASDLSPRDTEGHGSHTLSTVGGNAVPNTSVLGVGNGTAKGGSPKARVAAYKVCWKPMEYGECLDSDILAGFEGAIHDGVDVISVSLGGAVTDYFQDTVAIGSFHAVKKGIHVVCSAGNDGPSLGTVTNVAPWILTTGASTIDREFQAFVVLGNGLRFKGTTGALDRSKAEGKILACLRGENARVDKGMQAYLAGAAGLILCNDAGSGNELISDPHIIPASHINYVDGAQVLAYINTTENPTAYLTPATAALNTKPAPAMAAFSSRGPNIANPDILKPDVTAPGVNIIAAYSEALSPTEEDGDNRRLPYITMSGTSMSCPHVSGVVGLLKTLYPHWSPAAVRSALMTSGHIQPNRAMNPGLIYDLSTDDYLHFLCSIGYNQTLLEPFLEPGQLFKCHYHKDTVRHFNYPSFSIPHLLPGESVTLKREVTNVGPPGSYQVLVKNPVGVSISVRPKSLTFKKVGEVKSFKVTVRGEYETDGYVFGGISWSDGKHYVRSPVAVNVY
ncbi:hypothetical protein V2J09_001490 [Rumex salicifolius]